MSISTRLQRYAEATWLPPFPQPLPSDAEHYAATHSAWRIARRRFLRELNLAFRGQTRLCRDRIDPKVHRRVLWIHEGMPQVGDSLMDLAARVLLQGRVERLDLMTDAHLLPLYRADAVFTQVAEKPAPGLLLPDYDLVLLHSASSRSLEGKLAHYRSTPFVHVHGFYVGTEFSRTLFGYYRIAQLLGDTPRPEDIEAIACPSMRVSAEEESTVADLGLPAGTQTPIAVCVGGVRGWRTYTRWPEFLQRLRDAGVTKPVLLLGASNGAALRDEIVASVSGLRLIDHVDKGHSLGEVQAMMRRCALVVCADGGLLHVAHTTPTPVVTMFAGPIEPSFRVTAANRTRWCVGRDAVDDVSPADLLQVVLQSLAR